MQFTVDPEFKSLLPAPSPRELAAMEESIAKEGVRDPLVVWIEENILLDGHTRYEIAERLGKPFATVGLSFSCRRDARVWIRKNALARRNLDMAVRIKLALDNKEDYAAEARERKAATSTNAPRDERGRLAPVPPGVVEPDRVARETNARVAADAGASRESVRRYETVAAHAPDAIQRVEAHETTLNREYETIRLARKKAEMEAQIKARIAAERAPGARVPTIALANAFHWISKQQPCDLILTEPPSAGEVADINEFAGRVVAMLGRIKSTGRAYLCVSTAPRELRAYLNAPVPPPMTLAQVLVRKLCNAIDRGDRIAYRNNWQAVLCYVGTNAGPLFDCASLDDSTSILDVYAPEHLAAVLIRHSTRVADTVLDPFAGAGAFLLAAGRMERNAHGCELDADVVERAKADGCHVVS